MIKVVEILDQIEHEQGGKTNTYNDDKSHISFWKKISEQRQTTKVEVAKKVTKIYDNGDQYEGGFKDGKKHGQGTYIFANSKEKYVGEWMEDMMTGEGTFTMREGHVYIGWFLDSKFHGKGTINFDNGDKYVGAFKDDTMHGKGTYTFGPSSKKYAGDQYKGGYKNGMKHGKGTYVSADGSRFVGEYKDGLQHGQGTFTYGPNSEKAGDQVEVLWRNGKFLKKL